MALGVLLLKKEAQMRKLLFIFAVAGLMCFLASEYAFAEGEDGGPVFIKLIKGSNLLLSLANCYCITMLCPDH